MPERYNEIDENKLVVTACAHYDRAIIGRIFLVVKGIKARYLVEGLLGQAVFFAAIMPKIFMI